MVKLYKQEIRQKNESIHIDALHALNTCAEEEEKIKNQENQKEKGLSEFKTENKDKIEIKIDEKKQLEELEKGRSSGELTPNNQIFSAGRH